MIIVDLGCCARDEWYSLEALATRYHPGLIYGFDPSPQLNTRIRRVNGVPVRLSRKAAWTRNGTIQFEDTFIPGGQNRAIGVGRFGPYGRIGVIGEGNLTVPCFDFAQWLNKHGPCIVKMDIEGAEYDLLNHLIHTRTSELITELIIEWHDKPDQTILDQLTCPITDWWM